MMWPSLKSSQRDDFNECHTTGFGWVIRKLAFWKLSILDLICCPGSMCLLLFKMWKNLLIYWWGTRVNPLHTFCLEEFTRSWIPEIYEYQACIVTGCNATTGSILGAKCHRVSKINAARSGLEPGQDPLVALLAYCYMQGDWANNAGCLHWGWHVTDWL